MGANALVELTHAGRSKTKGTSTLWQREKERHRGGRGEAKGSYIVVCKMRSKKGGGRSVQGFAGGGDDKNDDEEGVPTIFKNRASLCALSRRGRTEREAAAARAWGSKSACVLLICFLRCVVVQMCVCACESIAPHPKPIEIGLPRSKQITEI